MNTTAPRPHSPGALRAVRRPLLQAVSTRRVNKAAVPRQRRHTWGGGGGVLAAAFRPTTKQRALGQGGTAPAARSAGKGTSVGTVQQHTGGDSAAVRATNSSAIERSQVRVPAVPAGELSSPGSTFCADSHFGIPSRPTTPPPRPCPACYRSST